MSTEQKYREIAEKAIEAAQELTYRVKEGEQQIKELLDISRRLRDVTEAQRDEIRHLRSLNIQLIDREARLLRQLKQY